MSEDGIGATAADVEAELVRVFEADSRSSARLLLEMCERGHECDRVKLAVLRLSRGDLRLLEHYIETARADSRDVLYWAFYPEKAAQASADFLHVMRHHRELLEGILDRADIDRLYQDLSRSHDLPPT